MPFNPSGLLVRLFRWADDRDAGTKILADRMDQEMDNAFDGINAILGGEQEFRGPVKVPFGTASEPSVQFATGLGLYRKSETAIGVAIGGVEIATIETGAGSASTVLTRAGGDARYATTAAVGAKLDKAGGTMTGNLDMGFNAVRDVGRLKFNADDYVEWVSFEGLRFFENNTLEAQIGRVSFINGNLTVGGGSVVHAARTTSQTGCIVFAKSTSSTTKTFGQTIPGDNLLLSDSSAIGSGILNGTWASLGRCQPGNSCSFIKVA